ncbi:MAG: homoserine kinase [Nitriliruptoraceae bacterium]
MTGADQEFTVRVPATSANLGPGFDAFGLALDRHLVVTSRPRRDGDSRVTTRGEGEGELATGDDNLVWRSFVAFCDQHGVGVPDVALHARNAIPGERGLGSSSSAIVAGIVLARAVTGTELGDGALVELANELEGHPDNVAPAILGGLVACTTDDHGRLVIRRINPAPHLRPVALVPDQRQSTQRARAHLPEWVTRDDLVAQASRAGIVLGALAGLWPSDPDAATDRLHEPARAEAMPAATELLGVLRRAQVHAWLSGAGPTVVALVDDEAALDGVRETATRLGYAAQRVTFDLAGAVVCPAGGCAFAGGGECVQCPRDAV